MGREAVIRFQNVSKKYNDKSVLENIDLEVTKGEFLTIIGSSGCGKTTLLKLINGLILADDGKVYIDGKDIKTIDQIKLRRNMGYVIQGIGLFPHMNILKNISYVPNLNKEKNKKEVLNSARDLIKVVGMTEDMLERYPSQLSGGQRQRVGIARALAARPEILLMDEPFGAVDEITRRSLQEELLKIHEKLGVTIVFITHDIKEALKLGTRVLVMDKGKIIQTGNPSEISENPKTDFVKELVTVK